MTNRKTLTKSILAGALALGTLAGGATVTQAGDFVFSWQTPQGTFVLGPNGSHFQPQQPRHYQPRFEHPRHVAPIHHAIEPRQARRILRQAGFRDISFLRERENVYVFEALGNRGYRRIAVNKFSGEILWRWGRG